MVREILKDKKQISLKTRGSSMFPIIKENDHIIVIRVSREEVKLGDVVAFYSDDDKKFIIAHRIIKKTNNNLILRGDNQWSSKCEIGFKNILGKVTQIKRGNKIIDLESNYSKFHGNLIRYLSIYNPPVLFIFIMLKKIINNPYLFLSNCIKVFRFYVKNFYEK